MAKKAPARKKAPRRRETPQSKKTRIHDPSDPHPDQGVETEADEAQARRPREKERSVRELHNAGKT